MATARIVGGRHALADHAREHGPVRTPLSGQLVQGTVLQRFLVNRKSSRNKVRYYLEGRDADFEQKNGRGLVCLSRGPGPKKIAATSKKPGKPVAIVVLQREARYSGLIATTAPDLPPVPGVYPTFARDYEYNAMVP